MNFEDSPVKVISKTGLVHAFWYYKKRYIRNTRWDFWKNKKQWLVEIELLRNMFLSQTSWKYQLRNMRSVMSDNQNFGINQTPIYSFEIPSLVSTECANLQFPISLVGVIRLQKNKRSLSFHLMRKKLRNDSWNYSYF